MVVSLPETSYVRRFRLRRRRHQPLRIWRKHDKIGDCARYEYCGCQKTHLKPAQTITLGVNGQLHFLSTLECTHNFDRRTTHIYFFARHDTFPAEVLFRLATAEAPGCITSKIGLIYYLVLMRFGQTCGVYRDVLKL